MADNEEIYRPTVRYASVYRDYVNDLFHSTTLDRNQIIRLALFCAPLSALFRSKIEAHLKTGETFQTAPWVPKDADLWKGVPFSGEASAETNAAQA